MASSLQNLSDYNPTTVPSGRGKKFGIAVAEWNQHITFALRDACIDTLIENGVKKEDIIVYTVPGTFELPYIAKKLARDNHVAAVICIGCVIKGETTHNDVINHSVAHALQDLNISMDIPFVFGVLTPNTEQQAIDRAGGQFGNKGVEAAVTALKMAVL
ncbi:MAG: 6,7-dimethyl-8-ribityllumazine synthase [Chitinophagales bacterium]|nr:6,7-dimethyl-8-ribityllumazine synthase [Chitinophagales bacterium]